MKAVVTRGQGGFEQLDYCEVPKPVLSPGEVLIRVLAAGVNNTEINTRLGWYSSEVTTGTNDAESGSDGGGGPGGPGDTGGPGGSGTAGDTGAAGRNLPDGGWDKPTPFPFIQGTDCCGRVVETGAQADPSLKGKRILVRSCMRPKGFESGENIWMGSDFDGAFAEYVKAPAGEVFPVDCDWTDEELGTIPCAYGTAENMLHRAQVTAKDTVLITGASGGVGSAAVQLARRRGARVIGIAGAAKADAVRAAGAHDVVARGADPVELLGEESVTVVVDNVGGAGFPGMLKVLRRGGRFVSSGAIGGPVVVLDMRVFYLKDITLIGCTAWDEPVFANLVGYIERGEIRPLLAGVFPLESIADAQRELLKREHVGKFVLVP